MSAGSPSRPPVLAWYGGVFGGLLPILLLGFLYSAIADRTVFAAYPRKRPPWIRLRTRAAHRAEIDCQ